ncbi:uncharacterized protein LOC127749813 [Frankliniella occidentalis]|uniref:Uncharacterized protein LOC127749813 n=1 Tax=Frankliniella occidentalis TaxID=133901 RepID=A0A9C6X0K9_FRAOC|nr:uncharacterized protein LOC127749813 [Frankliniella occidentalis]
MLTAVLLLVLAGLASPPHGSLLTGAMAAPEPGPRAAPDPEPDGHIAESGEKTEQYFAMEPQDQVAIEGTRVTLPCRVENKKGTLQWTKDDFGLGPHRNLSGFDRYQMVGSDEEGTVFEEPYWVKALIRCIFVIL